MYLNLSWRRSLSYKNQPIDLQSKCKHILMTSSESEFSIKPTKNSFSTTCYGDSCWKYGNWYLLLVLEQLPSRDLLAQSKQLKHKNNMWNLFKVNNKDTRINFTHCSGVPLLILNRLMMAWFDLLSKYILCTLFHLWLLTWKGKKCFFTKINSQRPKQLYIWIYI